MKVIQQYTENKAGVSCTTIILNKEAWSYINLLNY